MNYRDELERECLKLIRRFEYYARELRDDDRRRERRTGRRTEGRVHRPPYWDADRAFNPYLVRADLSVIAHSVTRAMREHAYSPLAPIQHTVPKPGGGDRLVNVYALADATVSRRVYRSLLAKNKSRLSAYSYAYRDDLTTHDAVLHISSDLKRHSRVSTAEYDFTKFFDSISHDHIWHVLDNRGFLLTDLERHVIAKFLSTAPQLADSYTRQVSAHTAPTVGVPQGTSISLFLANVAAWEIDRALERLGVGFARYADDTVIWSNDYGRICAAADALTTMGAELGAAINLGKSEGISILTEEGARAEFASKSKVDFVGYSISPKRVGLKPAVEARIKRRLAYLIYSNLLEPLKMGATVASRIAQPVDRDYLVMVRQLRRYLYGNISEARLRRLEQGRARQLHYPGVMAHFPMLDDEEALRRLDGWLLHTVETSLRKRAALLRANGSTFLPTPHGLRGEDLLRATAHSSDGTQLDLRLPSLVRISAVINRAARAHGPNSVAHIGPSRAYQYSAAQTQG